MSLCSKSLNDAEFMKLMRRLYLMKGRRVKFRSQETRLTHGDNWIYGQMVRVYSASIVIDRAQYGVTDIEIEVIS